MVSPVLAADLAQLRHDFDEAFEDRETSSDGWIGDTAHQEEKSGHNPDDTPGVVAEYSDSDTKPEVRAVDVTAKLNSNSTTMYDVIKKILATPADLSRLMYIIHCPVHGPLGDNVPTKWSRSNGWRPVEYTGANRHDKHAHFSGDPAQDENRAPWRSVLSMGDGMSDNDQYLNYIAGERLYKTSVKFLDTYDIKEFTATGGTHWNAVVGEKSELVIAVKDLQAKVKTLVDRPVAPPATIDQTALNEAVKVALQDPTVVAGLVTAVLGGIKLVQQVEETA